MPKLTIITVNLNNSKGLIRTIESVVNQTYSDFEYIIIDGGSIDNSIDVIEKYKDKITKYVSEPDRGIYNAMNKGIAISSGDYLQFLNSGDWLVDNMVLSRVFLTNVKSDIIYGNINLVYGNTFRVHKIISEREISLGFFLDQTLAHPGTFISKRLFANEFYDEDYTISSDKAFFLRKIVFDNCSLHQSQEIIANFNTEGLSHSLLSQKIILEENRKIFVKEVPPRIRIDYERYEGNFDDIQSLLKIKRYKIPFFFFKVLKKVVAVFE